MIIIQDELEAERVRIALKNNFTKCNPNITNGGKFRCNNVIKNHDSLCQRLFPKISNREKLWCPCNCYSKKYIRKRAKLFLKEWDEAWERRK